VKDVCILTRLGCASILLEVSSGAEISSPADIERVLAKWAVFDCKTAWLLDTWGLVVYADDFF